MPSPLPFPPVRRACLLAGLLLLAACSAEKKDWETAQTANTADSYRQYADKHPASPFTAEARKKWETLDFAAADAAGTADAYADFLRAHPAGANADQARGKRSMLVHGFSIDTRPVKQVKKLPGIFTGDWHVKDPDKNTGVIIRTKFHVAKEPMDLGIHDLALSYELNGNKLVEGCSGAGPVDKDSDVVGTWLFRDPEKGRSFTMALKKGTDDWSLVVALPQAATRMVLIYKDQEISRAFEMAEFPAEKKED